MDANLFDNKVEEDNNSRSGSVRDWLSAGEFWQRLWTFMFWPAGHEDDAEKVRSEGLRTRMLIMTLHSPTWEYSQHGP